MTKRVSRVVSVRVLPSAVAFVGPLGSTNLRESVLGSSVSVDNVLCDGQKSYPLSQHVHFRRFPIIAKNASYLRFGHPAVCPRARACVSTALTGRISVKFDIANCENLSRKSKFV